MKKVAEFIVRRRLPVLLMVLLVTIFFAYFSLRVEIYTAFSDLLPQNHPYVRLHNQFGRTFGGANIVLLSVEVKQGDIFNSKTLEKIKKLTEVIEFSRGVNNYQIFSIARQKVKDVRATAWGIEVQPVMWPKVPQSQEGIEQLQNIVYANPTIIGRLVSEDGKAALISASFFEERLDYASL
ncbi:MAG: RND transporter, partial [Deltaproteobacteria bacterium]